MVFGTCVAKSYEERCYPVSGDDIKPRLEFVVSLCVESSIFAKANDGNQDQGQWRSTGCRC